MADEAPPDAGDNEDDRGRQTRLSRERVLGAALELVDHEGLSALSMRRVAAELDVEAMALYRYTSSKDGLLDGLVEALYIELNDALANPTTDPHGKKPRTPSSTPHWRAELHRIASATYQVSLAHPHAVPLLATRMLAVPLARRPPAVLKDHERMLELLVEAGLDAQDAATAFRAVTAWILGYILTELRAMVDDPDESDPAFRLGLHHMPVKEFPMLRALALDLSVQGGLKGLSDGLEALLDCFVPGVADDR
ncbi:TetR/AcrR family transcriptional regulator (plasmid) [Kitasatospora sp. NBC_00070]|uniref:TetR/AcrR family transcriptional regulator n=1 Tax=Kitasatospora sp. NBC_00070 TaxID=2975962 RepID=UPI002F9076C8